MIILSPVTDILTRLRNAARPVQAVVALPEAEDSRILAAAVAAVEQRLCRPLLVGTPERVRQCAARAGLPLDLPILDPAADPDRERLVALLMTRGVPAERAQELVGDPLHYANLLVRDGRADGAVMGAVATTTETLRAALRVLGVDPRYTVVTSCFLMAFPHRPPLVYADCGVIPAPTAPQLADIAMQAAEAYRLLVGGEPEVALLSFATLGSARHASLDPVVQAVEILRQRGVDFAFDGELQADAALVPEVAARKAPASPVAGRANVLVFPDLNSGNIAYKLTERLAGARAIGPLLRGFARPVHDLSRGCSIDDILDTMAITALDAARNSGAPPVDRAAPTQRAEETRR